MSAHIARVASSRRGVLAGLTLLVTLISPLGNAAVAQSDGSVDTAGFPRRATIRGNQVNIRTGASTNHVSFTRLPNATLVAATGRNGEWIRLALPPAVPAWISQRYVLGQADGTTRVNGNRVRLRAYPNTKHTPIGLLEHGALLRPTGKIDAADLEYGPWVEIAAPISAEGWVHQDYLALETTIVSSDLARIYEGAPGPGPSNTGRGSSRTGDGELAGASPNPASVGAGGGTPEPAIERPEFRMPRVGREPFVAIYEKIRAENAKPPIDWKFEPILTDLRRLATRSEDLVVVDTAKDWIGIVEEHWVPTQRRMLALEQEKEAARQAREAAEANEREIEKRPGQNSTRRDKEFLAIGWVDSLGKYRKVDGTHRLLKGNRLVFYLKSEQLKLDDYVNKRVGISGVIHEQPPSAGAQLILVTAIQVLSD